MALLPGNAWSVELVIGSGATVVGTLRVPLRLHQINHDLLWRQFSQTPQSSSLCTSTHVGFCVVSAHHPTAAAWCLCCGVCLLLLQIKGTVLLMPNGSDLVTTAPLQTIKSDKKVGLAG